MCIHHPGLIKGTAAREEQPKRPGGSVHLTESACRKKMDLSSLLHLGGDYRNHKMILIDTFLPGFSLLGDNIDPRGVI